MVDYDPLYVAARGVLLDALEGLGSQRDAIVVVGAQAIYLRTGDADIGVAPYTTDADLALTPVALTDEPHLEELMKGADFYQEGQPGAWLKTVTIDGRSVPIPVDLMVPLALASAQGKRSAHIPPHDKMVARTARGLEGAAVDNDVIDVAALRDDDSRMFSVRVAGVAALLVAKLHKLHDRLDAGKRDRIADKDAADIYRLMVTVPVSTVVPRLQALAADAIAGDVTASALRFLPELFAAPRSPGVQMASESLRPAVSDEAVAAVCTSFTREVVSAITK